jgi:hypothetical protein
LQLAQCHQTNQKLQKSLPDQNDRLPRQKYKEINLFFPDSFKISPKPNTDNMGKLFVTLFAFAPAPKTDL